jgi:hypothetical protein
MSSTLSIAVSGMNAASTRLDVAASNIANEVTTGPIPTSGLSPLAMELLNAGSTNTASPSDANASVTGGKTPSAYVPLAFNQVDQFRRCGFFTFAAFPELPAMTTVPAVLPPGTATNPLKSWRRAFLYRT